MEENKQIIYHKSDWGKQVIYIVLVLAFLFFSYKKNPTKELFTQELIREYALKNGLDTSSSMWVSELTNSMFGSFVEPMIKRNDYIIFSTYEAEINNKYINGRVRAIGFWGNIFFDDEGASSNESPTEEEFKNWVSIEYPGVNADSLTIEIKGQYVKATKNGQVLIFKKISTGKYVRTK